MTLALPGNYSFVMCCGSTTYSLPGLILVHILNITFCPIYLMYFRLILTATVKTLYFLGIAQTRELFDQCNSKFNSLFALFLVSTIF